MQFNAIRLEICGNWHAVKDIAEQRWCNNGAVLVQFYTFLKLTIIPNYH